MWKHMCFKNKNKGYRVKPNCIIIISSSTTSSSIITIINNAIVRDTLNIKKKAIDRRVQHLFMSVCIRAPCVGKMRRYMGSTCTFIYACASVWWEY